MDWLPVIGVTVTVLAVVVWIAVILVWFKNRKVEELQAARKRAQSRRPRPQTQTSQTDVEVEPEHELVVPEVPQPDEVQEPKVKGKPKPPPEEDEDEDDWDNHPLAKRGLQTGVRNVESMSPALVEARQKAVGFVAILLAVAWRVIFGWSEGGSYNIHLFLVVAIMILWFVGFAIHKPRSFDLPIVVCMILLAVMLVFG